MKYNRFEETPIWQEARKFVHDAYSLLNTNKKLNCDYSLSDQFKRASHSVLLNISEGFERGSNADFAHFIDIAKGSAAEVRAIIYIMLDNNYISAKQASEMQEKIENISAQLSNFKRFLAKNKYKKQF